MNAAFPVSQKFAYQRKCLCSSLAIYGGVRHFQRISHDLIIIDDQEVADTYRKQFELLWKNAQ